MNQKSFTELYRQNKNRLSYSVLSMTKNPEVAEDIVSSAFIKAFEKRKSFRGDATSSTWLHAIAINETKSLWRRDRTKQMDSIDSPHAKELAQPDLLTKTLERSECCAKLRRVLRQIPSCYRKALIDHFVRGYTTAQIAKRQRIPLGTVLSRLFKARMLLREAWEVSR